MRTTEARSFDPLLMSGARMAILGALLGRRETEFMELMALAGLTRGNLSVHGRKLARAGYIGMRKSFSAGRPLTTFRLTSKGRRALREHVRKLRRILRRGDW